MVPLLEATQVRSNHRADGTLVGCAISQAADIFKDRANIEAGPAADAMQGIALLGVGQEASASIVE